MTSKFGNDFEQAWKAPEQAPDEEQCRLSMLRDSHWKKFHQPQNATKCPK